MMYIHPNSQQLLNHYVAHPPQSTLISGEQGIGFAGAIAYIADAFGVTPFLYYPEKDGKVNRKEGHITIEMIRTLYERTAHRSQAKRLIVIDGADTMGAPAQNAFLKLLEEPSPTTYFILLSHDPQNLLPTVRSRLTPLNLTTITSAQSEALLDELGVLDATKRRQLLFIADGRPALLTNLAQNNELFITRSQIMRDARTIIQGTTYQALQVVNTYKSRQDSELLLKDASRLLQMSMTRTSTSQIIARLQALLSSLEMIGQNGNPRLWLMQSVV